MKILVNKYYGGFSVSDKFVEYWCEKHPELDPRSVHYYTFCEERSSLEVIALVEYLGEEANGHCARLAVVEIPDTVTDWTIDEYDGFERVIYVIDGKLRYA